MFRVRGLAGLAAVSTVLLTGCGAVPDFSPGVAARVGDETVSVQRVADVAADYCTAAETQLQGQALANHYLNSRVASSLTLRSAAEQLMAEHGVQPDQSYDAAVAQADEQLTKVSKADRDAIVEVQGAEIFVQAAELAVGRDVLGGSPSDQDALTAGKKAFVSWLDDHDVAIDPRYGVEIKDGAAAVDDTSISYGISPVIKQADASSPDSAYAAGLPSSQRCG